MIERRALLLGAAALAAAAPLAACTTGSSTGPEPTPTGADDPDLALRGAVYKAESTLIAAYDATLEAHPSLRPRLAPFRAHHVTHRTTIDVGGALSATAAAAPAPSVPSSPSQAVAALAALERAAARARAADCATAARWQFARELGLVGGCEAAHHALLSGS